MTSTAIDLLFATADQSAVVQYGFLASLIGGLFGRNDKKKQQKAEKKEADRLAKTPMVQEVNSKVETLQKQWVDVDTMMADATKAGFNPVTWLMAGGMASYTQDQQVVTENGKTVTTGHNAAAVADLRTRTQVPSFGTVFMGAVNDTVARATQIGQANLFNAQVMRQQQIGAGLPAAMRGNRSFYTPTATVQGSLNTKSAYPTGLPTAPEVGDTTVTNPWYDWKVDPTQRDVAAVEERLGDSEIISAITGTGRFFDDLWYNVTGETKPERGAKWETYGRELGSWLGLEEYMGKAKAPTTFIQVKKSSRNPLTGPARPAGQ